MCWILPCIPAQSFGFCFLSMLLLCKLISLCNFKWHLPLFPIFLVYMPPEHCKREFFVLWSISLKLLWCPSAVPSCLYIFCKELLCSMLVPVWISAFCVLNRTKKGIRKVDYWEVVGRICCLEFRASVYCDMKSFLLKRMTVFVSHIRRNIVTVIWSRFYWREWLNIKCSWSHFYWLEWLL